MIKPNVQVESSWITSMGYDCNDQTLTILTKEAKTFLYCDVPIETAARFVFAQSNGKAYHELIKGQFTYAELKAPN